MKRAIVILIALAVLVSSVFVACKNSGNTETTAPAEGGLESADNEYGIQYADVTDANGEKVTDKNGEVLTTEINVRYELDENVKTIAVVIDENGEPVTDKNGNPVTVKPDIELSTKKNKTTQKEETTKPTKPTKSTTATTNGKEATTEKELTTLPYTKDKVPTIADAEKNSKGTVEFSSKDQQTIKNMLEVPYLYKANYENAKGVPINIAAHAALWMARREGFSTNSYASGTIVLDLFKYFGQTVVNFKTKVNNDSDNDNLVYNAASDSFTISQFESKKQDIQIQKIEFIGNNNYYLVTAKVTGAGDISKVKAIVQKNQLDATLGFSIKALKWSK